MNSKYERILGDYNILVSDSGSSIIPEYELSGTGISFCCPKNMLFPELFIQYCMNFNAAEEMEKYVNGREIRYDDLLQARNVYEKAEESLFSLAHALIRIEKEHLRNSITRMNDVIWYLLAETSVQVWEENGEFSIGWYLDSGVKCVIKCEDAEHIRSEILNAFRNFNEEQYVTEQVRKTEAGERISAPVLILMHESEQIYSFLLELTDMLNDETE